MNSEIENISLTLMYVITELYVIFIRIQFR